MTESAPQSAPALLLEIEQLRFTLDNVGAYVFTKDLDGRYTYANRMVLDLFGRPLDEVCGQTDEKFFDLSVSDDLRRHDRRVMDQGERVESEERNVVAQTGEVRYYWSVKLPLRNAAGAITGMCGISTDITDRRTVETALRQSELHFKQLFAQAPLGLLLLDKTGVVIDCNAKVAEYFGAPRDKIIGFDSIRDSQDRALVGPITKALAGEPTVIETAYTSTAGSRKSYCRYFFQPISIDDELTYVLCFAEDIGGVKRAEDLLLAREDLLTKILDTSSVAIFLVNPLGIITHANQCMAEMFGTTLEQIVGTEYVAHVDPAERQIGRQKMLALLASTIPSVDLVRLYWREDGTQFWGHLTGRRFQDGEGNDLGLVGVIADINERHLAEQALAKSQQRFHDLVDSTAGIVWEADAETVNFTYVSQEAERLLGYPLEAWLEPGFWVKHLHPEDRSWAPAFCAEQTRQQKAHDFEYRILARDGRLVWLRDIVKVIVEDGQPRWLRGVMVDITEHKQERQRHTAVIESAMDGFLIVGPDGLVRECNEVACELTGYSREEMLGLSITGLDALESPGETAAHMAHIFAHGRDRFESRWRRKDGATFEVEITAAHLSLSSEICAYIRDISLLKAHERELDHIAHFDQLTGVPNRTLLADRMNQSLAQTRRATNFLAVCYLDLDGFKAVNDRFGHDAGDALLIEVANRLQDCLRGGDTVARIGGDEFVLLLLDLAGEIECETALQRILASICRPIAVADESVEISASIGVALFPRDDVDADALLRHADQAMYRAKDSGKNRYHVFDPEHDRLARSRSAQLVQIGTALAQNEFVLFYQPQVNMRTGLVIGAEALIRWQHPQRGLLSPAEFLPLIENSDLIVAVGDWVLATALGQLACWRREGLDLRVSVNVAARHLLRQDFVARLQDFLTAQPEVPADRLELEVLETAALEDVAHVSGLIRQCRDMGVSFALDDFGTGYSSLAYLKLLPAEMLKIDQSFVRDMLGDAEDRAIVDGVIGLARVFGREVIAEGVETAEHGAMLLSIGCQLAQGYGIAAPMPAEKIPEWVKVWQPPVAWQRPT